MLDTELIRFRINNNFKYIVVDTETEGLSPFYSRPWQIAWIVVENGNIIKECNYFVKWDNLNVSPKAQQVTRFNFDNYLKIAKDPSEALSDLFSYLNNNDYYVVGQNLLFFDTYQINTACRVSNFPGNYDYVSRVYDTMALFKAYKLNIKFPEDKEDIIPWQYRLINFRQKGLRSGIKHVCPEFNIPYDESLAHDGLYDVIKTNEMFKQLIFKLNVH